MGKEGEGGSPPAQPPSTHTNTHTHTRTVAHGREALPVGRKAHRVNRLHVPRQRKHKLHAGGLVGGHRGRRGGGRGGGGGGAAAAAAAAASGGRGLQQPPNLHLVVRARRGENGEHRVEVDRQERVVFRARLRVPCDLERLCAKWHGSCAPFREVDADSELQAPYCGTLRSRCQWGHVGDRQKCGKYATTTRCYSGEQAGVRQAFFLLAVHVCRELGHVFPVSQRTRGWCEARRPSRTNRAPPPLTPRAFCPFCAAHFVSSPSSYDTVGLIACVFVVNACIAGYIWMAFSEAGEETKVD
jgi:hypothetical protein